MTWLFYEDTPCWLVRTQNISLPCLSFGNSFAHNSAASLAMWNFITLCVYSFLFMNVSEETGAVSQAKRIRIWLCQMASLGGQRIHSTF